MVIELFYGDNVFALEQAKEKRKLDYLASYDPFGLEIIDGEDDEINRLRDSVLQLPFLVEHKLVIINRPFSNKSFSEHLLELLTQIPDSIDILMIDASPDKRTKLFKVLQTNYSVVEYKNLKINELIAWSIDYAKSLGARMDHKAADQLVMSVGSDQMKLAREIEKLSLETEITLAKIDSLIEPSLEGTVFNLIDSAFSGNSKKTMNLYDQLLAKKIDPNEILGLLAWQLHALAMVKYSQDIPKNEIARHTGLHPFVADKLIKVANNISIQKLKEIINLTIENEKRIKTGMAEAEDSTRVLFLELTN